MASYSVAVTKDNLSALIDKALAGEEVVITRRGKVAVRMVPDTSSAAGKDVRMAMVDLQEWRKTQPPIATGIPYERFREWLAEDDQD